MYFKIESAYLYACYLNVIQKYLNAFRIGFKLSNNFGVDKHRKSIQTSFKVDKNGF